jgi:hypothetical protein
MNWKDILKIRRYKRYLQNEPASGKLTSNKRQPCDKCGAMTAVRNVKASKRGEHINLCNACKNKEE